MDHSATLAESTAAALAGDLPGALYLAEQARRAASNPEQVSEALWQSAAVLVEQGLYEEAAVRFSRVYQSGVCHPPVVKGLAKCLLKQGFPSRARGVLEAHPEPNDKEHCLLLAQSFFESRQPAVALQVVRSYMDAHPPCPAVYSTATMYANYVEQASDVLRDLGALAQRHYPHAETTVAGRTPALGRRLRVGFISADFYRHPVGYFTSGWIGKLGDSFEVTLIYTGSTVDSVTDKVRGNNRWLHLPASDSQQQLAQLRELDLDMLIELGGHTANNALPILAQRAAPVQLSCLGYMDSTFLPNIDATITDQYHLPLLQGDAHTAVMAGSRFCYDPPMALQPSAAPVDQNGLLTFGCFSLPAKITEATLDRWAAVLKALPTSQLLLVGLAYEDREVMTELRTAFVNRGVITSRVQFRGRLRFDVYLQTYADVDVMLDTTPFSGGTTSYEALSAGTPVLTEKSRGGAGATSAGALISLGLAEYIAEPTPQGWADCAVQIAANAGQLTTQRQQIYAAMRKGPLVDGDDYAKRFVALLDGIFEKFYQRFS